MLNPHQFNYALALLGLFLLGGIFTLGFAPFSVWPASLIALSVYYGTSFIQVNSKRAALLQALSFSGGILLFGCYWVYISIHDFGQSHWLLAIIMTLLWCGFIASLWLGFVWISGKLKLSQSPPLLRALGFTALWLLCEWLRSWYLTGFPWLYAGYTQIDGPLKFLSPFIGVFGLSIIISLSAALLAECAINLYEIRQTKANPNKALFASFITLAVLWIISPALEKPALNLTHNISTTPMKVAALQPNVDLFEKWDPVHIPKTKAFLKEKTLASDAALFIWPETAVAEFYHEVYDDLKSFGFSLRKANKAVLTGVPSFWYDSNDNGHFYNSMLGIGYAEGIYHKQKLVPFGEYLPFEDQLRGLINFFDLPLSQFTPGPHAQDPITLFQENGPSLSIMPYICYEIVYPSFVAQSAGISEILITVSNDAWFGDSTGPIQHFEMARMRALETGRYIIRATNNGITAFIGPDGNIIKQLPSNQQGMIEAQIYPRKGYTPVTRYGTLAPVLLSFVILVLLALKQRYSRP